ncbi:hypothetical protein K435DRAFT_721026 [Dendrothele bispora CBS 962.96]|uniref:MARVEL domain-containing protein n=1 Tax=Dendrothele bispora (strain CBS 962.96) TaxID=1314807 RepID=A0A4S8M7E6_DENBC|nr:hypothetical protein K435DRAFT_721026 [Dendrothele bispora CBS 962.96]
MKPRDYCCCAIPTVNAGIYLTLLEQMALGVLVGVLSMAAPEIVGSSVPMMVVIIFGILCFAAAGLQLLGFIGVATERPILFRRFLSLHSLLITACFSMSGALIIISATRHSSAKARCTTDFFVPDPNNADSVLQKEADKLCEIFPWVDVGVMGGLWVILAAVHTYLYTVMAGYSTEQESDHEKYNTLTERNPKF